MSFIVIAVYLAVAALVFAKAIERNRPVLSLAIAAIWPISAATLLLQKEPRN